MSEKSTFKYEFDWNLSHITYRKPITPDAYDCIARRIIHKEDAIGILVQEFEKDLREWLEKEVWK